MFSFFKKKGRKQSLEPKEMQTNKTVSPTLNENIQFVYDSFCHTDDLQMKEVTWKGTSGVILYIETIVDINYFQQNFWIPLSEESGENQMHATTLINRPEVNKTTTMDQVIADLVRGNCAIFLQGKDACYLFNSTKENDRSPDEPENEKAVRGSHKGFIENMDMNLNAIRGRIRNPKLTIKYLTLGSETHTNVAIVYMNGIANMDTVKDLQKRLESISSDMTFSPGYIEESIEDTPLSPFPQIMTTQRPDRAKANIMEGRIAIFTDGSADSSIVPVSFFSFFQSSDDYNLRFFAGSIFRLLRLFSFLGTLLLPAIYIAVIGFHFEIIPYELVNIVKNSIENIPFPPLVEALIMATMLELIRESGIRLPSPIGETIGIVGGLIIGDAVINAGLISNIMVIVVALTAIMSFSIPSYEMSNTVRFLSLPIMIGAATLGFVGIVFVCMLIIIHMCTLHSFGTPYLSPLSPFHWTHIKDALIRVPNWMMKKRPTDLRPQKTIKQGNSRKWDQHDQ